MKPRARAIAIAVIATLLLLAPACSGDAPPAPDATSTDPTQLDMDEVERLRALGYVNVAPALPPDARVGVLTHDTERAAPGLNLFTNAKFCSTQLIDMQGRVLNTWSSEPCFRWGNVALLHSGELLVVVRTPHEEQPQAALENHFLMRLKWNGDLVWKKRLPVHHDVELAPNGRIMTLTYAFRVIPEVDPEIPVRDNSVAMLDKRGELLDEVSLWEVLRSAPELFTLQEGKIRNFEGGREVDLFHSNSVEWIRMPDLIGSHPIYGPDSVLICIRNQDTLAILDWKTKKLQWAWGQGELSGPHDATLLPNGHILAFDNGLGRDYSRVVEVDPLTDEIVWEYRAAEPQSFYSMARGANQRLANGNTLVTESDDGRLFEVTSEGEIVWEFLNPNMTDEREPSVIVRARRIEGLDYEELVERIESGRGLPSVID